MDTSNLKQKLTEAAKEYIAEEEIYSDNVQVQINTLTGEVVIADPENDLPDCDYYPVMDLIRMSTSNPGQWEPDPDAIDEVVADYATE